MRTRAGLIAIVIILLVVMGGCMVPVEEEIAYRPVSLGPLSVSIPRTLERSQENLIEQLGTDIPEGVTLDAYDSTSDKIALMLADMGIKQMMESQGESWEGWEALAEQGVTRGMIAVNLSLNNILRGMGVWSVTRQVNRQFSVNGKEAWELQYRSELVEKKVYFHFLFIFGDEQIWVVLYSVNEDARDKYNGSWDVIRDSVKLNLIN